MNWAKDSLFERAPLLGIRLGRQGRIEIELGQDLLEGTNETLHILSVFSKPTSLGEAIPQLQTLAPGFAAFTEMFDQVHALVSAGVLVPADGRPIPELGSDSSRFDSFPVHIRMLNDVRRTSAFQAAIRRAVRPGDVVLEIGTGTGILATTAAKAGAKRVYAIEQTPFARIAAAVFKANGVEDRVTVVEQSSLYTKLPEKAGVLIGEVIGNDPFGEDVRRVFSDAAERLLTPDALYIPARIRVYAHPLSLPASEVMKNVVSPDLVARWREAYEIELAPLALTSARQAHWTSLGSHKARDWPQFADPLPLLELDLRQAGDRDFRVERTFTALREGLLTGIMVTFALDLGTDEWFSTTPEAADARNHWRSPVWLPGTPIPISAGSVHRIVCTIRGTRTTMEFNSE